MLGSAERDGVQFSWWLIVTPKFFAVENGKRVYLPENDETTMIGEPGRLDDLPGMARVPMSATYSDEKHRNANGVQHGVSTWAEVPLLPNRPPITIDAAASLARRDLLLMAAGSSGGLLGVPADVKGGPHPLRSQSYISQETVSDAEFATAVRRGLADLRELDEVRDAGPED